MTKEKTLNGFYKHTQNASAAGDFKDDFESGDTLQWRGDRPSTEDVAVEDGFESGDASQWQGEGAEPDEP